MFRIGDKVRIQPKEWYEKYKNELFRVDKINGSKLILSFVSPMTPFLGETAVIKDVCKYEYSADEKPKTYYHLDFFKKELNDLNFDGSRYRFKFVDEMLVQSLRQIIKI